MQVEDLKELVIDALDDRKAQDIQVIDVRDISSVTDIMVIATGTSTRHVKSVASYLVEKAKEAGQPPFGSEGEETGEWVLVDLGDVVAHIMTRETRDFYQLERLWSTPPMDEESANA